MRPGNTSEWYKANGDNTYRINYDLNPKSVVVDIGARVGKWADLIRGKYGCNIYCFEPVKEFCESLKQKKYTVFDYAVADKFGVVKLGISGKQASMFHDVSDAKNTIHTNLIPASEIFKLIKKDKIDLMKINVEGAEYAILRNLIENNLTSKIKSIQVQFHISDGIEKQYDKIAEGLKNTHKITWRFPFVWENWELDN